MFHDGVEVVVQILDRSRGRVLGPRSGSSFGTEVEVGIWDGGRCLFRDKVGVGIKFQDKGRA